jgi:hypothetical protein
MESMDKINIEYLNNTLLNSVCESNYGRFSIPRRLSKNLM